MNRGYEGAPVPAASTGEPAPPATAELRECRACYYGHPNECERGIPMGLYVSKPQAVEAVQWTGDWDAVEAEIGERVRLRGDAIELLAGKDGAQEWVPVPVGHWLVHAPGDLSDVWPVDPDYFAGKYDRA